MSWTLIADGVVAVLLVATLIYVRRFGRQLEAIRSSRGEFEKLIADLTRSTDQAASHLHQFKATAEGAGRDLQARTDRAQGLTSEFGRIGDDLTLLIERAERASNQLEAAIARARSTPAPNVQALAASPSTPADDLLEEEGDHRVASLSALSGMR
ncbi:MAG TPA: DUF6468 domain-containing protein [Dongiaceae bacterium]